MDKVAEYFYKDGIVKRLTDLKKQFPNIDKNELEDWYYNQKIVQIMTPPLSHLYKSKNYYQPIISFILGERLYIDTMFFKLKKGTVAIVVGIEWFSRFCVAKLFFLKVGKGISPKQTVNALDDFLDEFKKHKVKILNIITDNGNEFLGEFKSKVKELGIKHILSEKGDVIKQSPIESMNRTLRKIIESYRELHSIVFTNDILKQLVNSYNNLIHSKLGYTPSEVISDQKIQKIVLEKYWERKADAYDKMNPILENGTWVRYYIRDFDGKYKKLKRNFSLDLYQIKSFDTKTQMYELENVDRKFRREQLLVVDKDKFDKLNMTPDKIRTEIDIEKEQKPRKEKNIKINKDLAEILEQPVLQSRTRSGRFISGRGIKFMYYKR
jgi:hypothetical protein